MSYKKHPSQQYVVQRKKVLSTVESKVKRVAQAQKGKTVSKSVAPTAPTPAVKTEAKVKEKDPEALGRGMPATLHYDGAKVKVSAKVRYETMKTEALIKTALQDTTDGKIVHKRFEGTAKVEVYVDDEGNKHDKKNVKLVQELEDGSYKSIDVHRTGDIKVEAVNPRVMEEFQPYSFLEVWGEEDADDDDLRALARDLIKMGKVGGVDKFSHGMGGKMYVGFLKPILSKDGKSFTVQLMLAENKWKRRRWMPAEPGAEKAEKVKPEAPVVPKMW